MSIEGVTQLLGMKSDFEKWPMDDISGAVILRA